MFSPSCIHCGKKIVVMKGIFSGVYYEVEKQGKVHEECIDDFQNNLRRF